MTARMRIGDWEVHPGSNEVAREGETVRVRHQVMALLLCLARRPGLAVSKEELVREVWEGAFTSDEALAAAVCDLRRLLGDDARSPVYVETIRKRGYRLVAPVRAVEGREPRPLPSQAAARPVRSRLPRTAAVVLLAALAGASATVLWQGTLASPEPAGPAPAVRSLAVLPMVTFTPECRQDFFADGLTEMLEAELISLGALEVAPGISVRSVGGAELDLSGVVRELEVDAVVEGTVLRSGDRLWLSVQLVEAATGRLLWGGSYERELGDPLALQHELASDIAQHIRLAAGPGPEARQGRSPDAGAMLAPAA